VVARCGLLGYDAVQTGSLLPTFRMNVLPTFSGYPANGDSTFLQNAGNLPSLYTCPKPETPLHVFITVKTERHTNVFL
jgi:hypothetical protein